MVCDELCVCVKKVCQKRHACHAKRRPCVRSVTPAAQKCRGVTRDQGAPSAPPDPATCQKYHACQAKREPVSEAPRLPRKMQVDVAKCHACHAKYRGVTGDQGDPSAPPDPAQSHNSHACHAKRRLMSPSATPDKDGV